ncbi:hypothetical protein V6N13_033160 [Hibiscus sabdariffa]
MAGRVFLLEVEDEDLYNLLKDSGWSYLKQVFTEVHPWSESFRPLERVVWLEMVGVPLHCWNQQTFRRIAELWGDFLALGENAFQMSGVEKMSILISTSQIEKVESIIDIEVGKELFPVRISEISCSEAKLSVDPKKKRNKGNKYGSLKTFPDRVLTETERKKRDRALRRLKKKEKAQWVGFEIEDDSEEAIRDLVKLNENQGAEPPENRVKFSVDGSATSEKAGCGGVLRDAHGVISIMFSGPISHLESDFAELVAILKALELFKTAKWIGRAPPIVESDSKIILN